MRIDTTRVKQEMKRQNMGVENLAQRMGLSRSSVYYYLSPSSNPSIGAVARLAQALGVEPKSILK